MTLNKPNEWLWCLFGLVFDYYIENDKLRSVNELLQFQMRNYGFPHEDQSTLYEVYNRLGLDTSFI